MVARPSAARALYYVSQGISQSGEGGKFRVAISGWRFPGGDKKCTDVSGNVKPLSPFLGGFRFLLPSPARNGDAGDILGVQHFVEFRIFNSYAKLSGMRVPSKTR